MAMPDQSGRDAAVEQELARLKQNYERLRDDKVRTEQDLANLTRQLEELEAHARAEYGTADPQELTRLLETRRADNERAVAEYREHLNSVQAQLAATEQGLGE